MIQKTETFITFFEALESDNKRVKALKLNHHYLKFSWEKLKISTTFFFFHITLKNPNFLYYR